MNFKVSIVYSMTDTGRMGLVMSFQDFTRITSVIVLTGSLFSAFSILLKEHLFN